MATVVVAFLLAAGCPGQTSTSDRTAAERAADTLARGLWSDRTTAISSTGR
ncbi:hypothetical protein ABZV93_18785 [Actinopolymorpha sp. NPDC004070]|uniref:hypothetical protein n=1 Tax=Actinopolymorpha sp. NPDC004070 TaxID=3154548 RepID=UPI0033B3162A